MRACPIPGTARETARSVMTAYNSVDGSPATQSRKLSTGSSRAIGASAASSSRTPRRRAVRRCCTIPNRIPRPRRRTHSRRGSTSCSSRRGRSIGRISTHFERGLIADSIIDAAVTRVLAAKFELGLFERPYVDPDSAAYWNGHATIARWRCEAARASIVLLRNDAAHAPARRRVRVRRGHRHRRRRSATRRIQRAGEREGFHSRRRSARRFAWRRQSCGTRRGRVASRAITSSSRRRSSRRSRRTDRSPGLQAEYFDNNRLAGEPRVRRADPQVDFGWTLNSPAREIPFDWYSVRWTGMLTVPPSGVRRIGVEGNDGYRLYIDGKLVVDNWSKQSYGTRLAERRVAPGIDARHSPRVLREHGQRAREARVGRWRT